MTPEEKAKELMLLYYELIPMNTVSFAKHCALTTVDEIMDFLYEKDLGYMYYWEEVKREIYNL
jgi:hypothetical protein